MRTVFALGLLVCMSMAGWYGPIPSFVESNGWRAPSYLQAAPNWNVALAWLAGAGIFLALKSWGTRRSDRGAPR